MLYDAMNSELIYGSLKDISALIHSNCIKLLELIYSHLKTLPSENVIIFVCNTTIGVERDDSDGTHKQEGQSVGQHFSDRSRDPRQQYLNNEND